jgi:hypothetical protein
MRTLLNKLREFKGANIVLFIVFATTIYLQCCFFHESLVLPGGKVLTPYMLVFKASIAISIASLIYYASSFLNSKGVHMGTYFMVSSLAMVPVIFGVLVLYPIASIISMYIGLLLFIFTFLYTLISFFLGMNEVLVFGNINKRILYNVINLSLIFLIMIIIFVLCFRLNILIPPEIYF